MRHPRFKLSACLATAVMLAMAGGDIRAANEPSAVYARTVASYPAPALNQIDGREYKVRIDVGARALDHRGLYKNAGK